MPTPTTSTSGGIREEGEEAELPAEEESTAELGGEEGGASPTGSTSKTERRKGLSKTTPH